MLIQETRCKDVDGWVDARMLSHTQPISSSAASSVLFHLSIPVFLFKHFTMTLQCCLMTLVQLLHGEFTLRCGVLPRGFSPFQLCENSFAVNRDSLQSLHKRTDCRRRAIIFSGYPFRVASQAEWPS